MFENAWGEELEESIIEAPEAIEEPVAASSLEQAEALGTVLTVTPTYTIVEIEGTPVVIPNGETIPTWEEHANEAASADESDTPQVVPVAPQAAEPSQSVQPAGGNEDSPAEVAPVVPLTIVSEADPIMYFSDEVRIEEHLGLTHWMLWSDGDSIFVKNYVLDTKVAEVMSDLDNVVSLAVDTNAGYLFISTQPDDDRSEVNRYSFAVNITNRTHPTITVNETSKYAT